MKRIIGVSQWLLVLTLAVGTATAESTDAEMGDLRFHAGAGLTAYQPIVSDLPVLVPKLEAGLIIVRTVDVYLALGLDLRHESFEDDNRESSSTAGALLTEVGARFIIGSTKPKSAFFHVGVALAPVIGIASYDSDDEDDDYYEDRVREYLDRFDLGLMIGIHYMVGADFGIGAETGFVTSFNNLKEIHREEPDKHLQVGFFIPFTFRMAYYF